MLSEVGALGAVLRAAREHRSASFKEIAAGAHVSVAWLWKLERGHMATPSPHMLHRVAAELGLSYVALMRLAGYPMSDTDLAAQP